MADILRIKRRLTGSPGAPASLANAELAYNETDHILYYGEGTGGAGGTATVVVGIGGQGLASAAAPAMDGAAAAGVATAWARGDHVHPSDTSRAPLVSPALTGTPTAPTVAPATDNSTKIATTGFVQSAISAVSSGVTSIAVANGLSASAPSGAVTIGITVNGIANASLATMAAHTYKGNNAGAAGSPLDLTAVQVMTDLGAAALASPTFTGTPAAPTPPNGTNTTQLATTAYVLAVRHDQIQPPAADVPWNSYHITGLLDPSNPQDAATKNYVDATVQGMQIKPTARLATAAALPANTYANGAVGRGATLTATASAALSVDGVAVAAGDLVLIKNEAAAANNGLYTVTNPGSGVAAYVLTRSLDMDRNTEYSGGFVPVESAGTVNSNTLWLCNPSLPITVGTTAIPFNQLNAATTYNAGSGINIAGNVISVTTIPNTSVTGLGTMATQNASAVAITGGTIDGVTIDGGTF